MRKAQSPLSQQLLAEMRDPLFAALLRLLVDGDGKPVSPFANLSPEQIAQAEGISIDALNENHSRDDDPDAAPPRYPISSRRWGYVAFLYVAWKIRQIRKAEAGAVLPWRSKPFPSRPHRKHSANNEVIT
jgi:hypothetical protein